MDLPVNTFKQALLEGRTQIGLWCALADAYGTEIGAAAVRASPPSSLDARRARRGR